MKIIIIIAILIFIISFLSFMIKYRKEKREKVLLADKIREEALDKLLMNQQAGEKRKEENIFAAVPVAVNYDADSIVKIKEHTTNRGKQKFDKKKVMVQIIENSELSARKYMLNPRKEIYIGRKNGKNHIVINHADIAERQCVIKEFSGKVYVKNMGFSGKVVLKRGKQSAYVEQKYMEVKSGDALVIGNMLYRIEIVTGNE